MWARKLNKNSINCNNWNSPFKQTKKKTFFRNFIFLNHKKSKHINCRFFLYTSPEKKLGARDRENLSPTKWSERIAAQLCTEFLKIRFFLFAAARGACALLLLRLRVKFALARARQLRFPNALQARWERWQRWWWRRRQPQRLRHYRALCRRRLQCAAHATFFFIF